MLISAVAFVFGLVALFLGAEWLVRGASTIARSFGVHPLIIGLTIVAFGTSAPELVVSALAAGRGQSTMALGNVVGSNIFNVLVILGVAALIYPIRVQATLLVRELPIMIVAALAVPVVAMDGLISRLDALLLFIGFTLFLGFMLWISRASSLAMVESTGQTTIAPGAPRPDPARPLVSIGLLLAGLAGLIGGAQLLVTAAVDFARFFGVSEVVIGLTIVAAGTSLPELATSVVAAMRKETDIALGNIVGSNIFNALCILGVAGLLQPIEVPMTLLRMEVPVMVGASLIIVPLAWTRLQLTRLEGALLVAGYVGFLALLLYRL
jgi:cation:H+ antiporter